MILILPALLVLPPLQDDTAATDAPQTTVVTARKVEESADRVPVAVTAIDGDVLHDAHVRTMEEALQRVPNVVLTEFTARRLSFPYIRGIGSGQGEPAVVTYIDGVPQLTLGSSNLPTVGLDRIEVLRGPQGSYGRNALGGVIHMISERPSKDASTYFGATTGDYGLFNFEAGFNGMLDDSTGLTVDVLHSKREGYSENIITGNDIDSRESTFGRANLYLTPGENSQLRLGIYSERSRDGGFALAPLSALELNPHEVFYDFEGVTERDVVAPSVLYEWFGDSGTFTSVSSYTDWDILETSDFDFTPIDGIRRTTTEDQQYFYQELRYATDPDGGIEVGESSKLRWLAGLSFFSADSGRSAANDFRPDVGMIINPPPTVGIDTNRGEFDDTGIGLFGQATLETEGGWEFSAGLRYDREDKEADLNHTFDIGGFIVLDENRSFEDDFDQVSPSLSAAYHIDENATGYASIGKAFKAGGFNLAAPAGDYFYEPEEATSFEVGYKRRFEDGKYNLRLAAFTIDWDDMQLSLFDLSVGGYVDNAGSSSSAGIEAEFDAVLSDNLTAFASIGTANTEFDRFVDTFSNDYSGNTLPFAPDLTWAVGGEYRSPFRDNMDFVARAIYRGVGDFYYDPSNLGEESYEVLDLRAGLRTGDWSFDLFLRNALDEEYFPIAFGAGAPGSYIAETGAPQTFGFSVRLAF